jgi:hypothetical protein
MSEEEYFASEFSDAELGAAADAGLFHLEEEGFFLRPTQAEIQKMVQEGLTYLLPPRVIPID